MLPKHMERFERVLVYVRTAVYAAAQHPPPHHFTTRRKGQSMILCLSFRLNRRQASRINSSWSLAAALDFDIRSWQIRHFHHQNSNNSSLC